MFSNVDANDVDLSSGQLQSTQSILQIGPKGSGLSYTRSLIGTDYLGTFNGTANAADAGMIGISIGTQSEAFLSDGAGGYTPADHGGSTLVSGPQGLVYTTDDGTVAEFSAGLAGDWPTNASLGRLTKLTKPSGEVWTYTYSYVNESDGSGYRLNAVTSSRGYQVHWRGGAKSAESDGINLSVDQCDPAAYSCPNVTQPVPDAGRLSRLITYTVSQTSIVAHRPSGGVDKTYALDGQKRVISMSDGLGTWSYDYSIDAANHLVTTVTDPVGHKSAMSSSSASGMPHVYYQWADRNGDGQVQGNELTNYTYDSASGAERLSAIIYPEGNKTTFTYDSRGNVTSQASVPKPGSSEPTLTTFAVYPQSCDNPKTCNKPTSVTDAKGYTTDFTYAPEHGGVLTVTQPAQANGVRPQVRYEYQGSSGVYWRDGNYQHAAAPIWQLASAKVCQTQQTCADGSDELVSGRGYSGNNALPTSTFKRGGDYTGLQFTNLTYDTAGNITAVNGPLVGSADTVRYYYDAARQLVGVVGPSPNGGGPTKNRAIRYQYDLDGRLVWQEQGTTNDQSDGAMASFDSIVEQLYERDPQGRVAKSTLLGRFGRTQMTQNTYYANGLLACSTVRMNPWTFDSEPASACDMGLQSNYGPDRITVYAYDGANALTSTLEGLGTPDSRYTSRLAYTPNGKVAWTLDANTNGTWYEYDGLDRLLRVRHPDPNNGLTISPTDYEQYAYDNNSNVLYERRRDGTIFQNDWDALNRRTYAYRADDSSTAYVYDNLGQVRSALSGSKFVTSYYDALGRWYAESDEIGYMVEEHDEIGRTWQVYNNLGANSANLYNASGDLTTIVDSSGSPLVSFTYDDLGRRTSISRVNGVTTSYGYDGVSRLTTLTHDLAGSDKDVQISLDYNPAGQIRTRSVNNGSYDYVDGYGVVRPYSNNALNQVTQSGGQAINWTATGNLQADGSRGMSFGYDNVNRLTSARPSGQGTASIAYDPFGRLRSTTPAGGQITRFRYDGDEIISEHDASGAVRSYVYGPGVDEPLIAYGPAGRQWTIADERGSIMAMTNDQGVAVAVNSYDAYGVPGSNNQGRFQFTGQAWLPEAGLYHYKARAYSPTLGRFLQPDPIGYGGGLNMYSYVGGDPVNSTDPTGLINPLKFSDGGPGPSGGSGGSGSSNGSGGSGFFWNGSNFQSYDLQAFGIRRNYTVPGLNGVQARSGGEGSGGGGTPGQPPQSTKVAEVVVTARRRLIPPKVFSFGFDLGGAFGFGGIVGGGVTLSTGCIQGYGVGGVAVGEGASFTVGGGVSPAMSQFTGHSVTASFGLGVATGASVSANGSGFGATAGAGPGVGAYAGSTYTALIGPKVCF